MPSPRRFRRSASRVTPGGDAGGEAAACGLCCRPLQKRLLPVSSATKPSVLSSNASSARRRRLPCARICSGSLLQLQLRDGVVRRHARGGHQQPPLRRISRDRTPTRTWHEITRTGQSAPRGENIRERRRRATRSRAPCRPPFGSGVDQLPARAAQDIRDRDVDFQNPRPVQSAANVEPSVKQSAVQDPEEVSYKHRPAGSCGRCTPTPTACSLEQIGREINGKAGQLGNEISAAARHGKRRQKAARSGRVSFGSGNGIGDDVRARMVKAFHSGRPPSGWR